MTPLQAPALHRRPMHENWTVRPVAGPVPEHLAGVVIPASVPGCVHTDLMAAGQIADPYLDDNEAGLQWIGRSDWEYRSAFEWESAGHDVHELVFEGLDTVATVTVNGTPVARTRNMHRTYRVDVTGVLRRGENTLDVRFESPVRFADRESLRLGYRPHVNHHPYNAIRKMACSFGWDWGIDTASSGIWRPVRLESWSTARIEAVRPVATLDGADGKVAVHIDIARAPADLDTDLQVAATVAGQRVTAVVAAGQRSATVQLTVPQAELWWPRGYGAQPLHEVRVELGTAAPGPAATLDTWSGRIGFRSVRLEIEPDAEGTSFRFLVNDVPVFIRGANWIPDDAFPHRVDRSRIAARLDQAEHANLNLLRVWGGGVFESDDFYDLCDERGIMTWQDFLFACAAYTESEPMRSEVEAEARDNVTRLMPHPSLVLWNGNNENLWGFSEWGWQRRLQGRSWGLGYYADLLPAIVAELDPQRPYTPGSPWSGSSEIDANDARHGSMHSWELWNRLDYPHYRDAVPRFMAEFGWQGPPTWSTLTRSLSDDPLTPESPGMLVHQKAQDGNDKLTDSLVGHLPLPDDMEDWHWAMSLNQAHAVQFCVEHLRSWSPTCMGAVIWQLNDCWPVTSWAAVDGDGRAKPLLYAVRRAFADRLLTVQPRTAQDGTDQLVVAVVNDSAQSWNGALAIRRIDYEGVELDAVKIDIEVPARATVTVPIPGQVSAPADPTSELIVATLDRERALWFFAECRDSAIGSPSLTSRAKKTPEGVTITVTATNLVRDVCLLVDKVHPDAVVDEMLTTLLPGESAEFHVRGVCDVDPRDFLDERVIRSSNQLVASWRWPRP